MAYQTPLLQLQSEIEERPRSGTTNGPKLGPFGKQTVTTKSSIPQINMLLGFMIACQRPGLFTQQDVQLNFAKNDSAPSLFVMQLCFTFVEGMRIEC